MNEELLKKIKTFAWGMGGFLAVAVCAYLANISDIQEIDWRKLATIVVTAGAGYIVNAITKEINK